MYQSNGGGSDKIVKARQTELKNKEISAMAAAQKSSIAINEFLSK